MLRVSLVWTTGGGAPYYTSFYFGGTTEGEASAAHAAVTDFSNLMEPFTVDNLVWNVSSEIDVVDTNTGKTTATFTEPQTDHQGTVTADVVPWASQMLIRWRTGEYVDGREIRGRTFWPGLNDGAVVDGVVTSSFRNTVQGVIVPWLGSPEVVGAGQLVVFSPTKQQAAFVSTVSIWEQVAVLRSRRP